MAEMKEKIIIRCTAGFKQRLERTAKKENKDVSTYIRDILSMFIDSKIENYQEYIDCLVNLKEFKLKEQIIKAELFSDNLTIEKYDDLQNELIEIQRKVYDLERELMIYLPNLI